MREEWKIKIGLANKGKVPWSKGKHLSLAHIKKIRQSNLGKKRSIEAKQKMSNSKKGKISNNFKGEKAGYHARHKWVIKSFGQPSTCELCKKRNLYGHKIHWANISDEYKFYRQDWLRLCVKCHGVFDSIKRLLANSKKYDK